MQAEHRSGNILELIETLKLGNIKDSRRTACPGANVRKEEADAKIQLFQIVPYTSKMSCYGIVQHASTLCGMKSCNCDLSAILC